LRLNFLTPPPLPAELPDDLEQEVARLARCKSQAEVLHEAYNLLTRKYRGYRLKTITHLFALFDVDVHHLWAKRGFLHCTHLNYLLKILLVCSGKFAENDVQLKWTQIYFHSPHQYVRVRLGGKWVCVDVWGNAYGIPFGSYAHGFHSGSTFGRAKSH